MSSNLVEQFDEMERVVERYIRGENPTVISKSLNMPRTKVMKYIEDWKIWARQNRDIKERARDMLQEIDQHYAMIIKEMWSTIEEAGQNGNLAVKSQTLKALASVEKDRQAMFQAAGLHDDDELAEQLQETERKQEILHGILKDVTSKCPNCKIETRKRLSEAMRTAEVIPMEEAGLKVVDGETG